MIALIKGVGHNLAAIVGLFADGRVRVGYLLKDLVASLSVLVDALRTLTAGGTVLDPEVVVIGGAVEKHVFNILANSPARPRHR